MRANQLLKHNIETILKARGQSRKDLAQWCHRGESWISKIFRNNNREIPLKYLDRIADFFGLSTYQLFQPGISPLTERRRATDRRAAKDRRIGHAHREMQTVAADVNWTHPRRKGDAYEAAHVSAGLPEPVRAFIADTERRVAALLAETDLGRQTPRSGKTIPKARRHHRDAGGPDPEKA